MKVTRPLKGWGRREPAFISIIDLLENAQAKTAETGDALYTDT
jgi:hypothetical protein